MKGKVELLETLNDVNGPYYILIEGCESDPQYWRKLIDHPDLEQALANAKDGVINAVRTAIPDHTVYLLRLTTIRRELNSLAWRVSQKHPGSAIVTLSSVYCDDHDFELEANRMIDTHNVTYRNAGPRPFTPPLTNQIESVKIRSSESSFILVDDVCFDGKTARTLVRLGLQVNDIVGGVVTERAWGRLTSRRLVNRDHAAFPGEQRNVQWQRKIRLHSLIRVGQDFEGGRRFVDTVPIHDFIPFSPLSGKTVGVKAGSEVEPLVVSGVSFSKPYLLPYLDRDSFSDAASIPAGKDLEFSSLLLENALRLFEQLETLADRDLTVRELAYHNPRFSFPFPSEKKPEIDLDESVTQVLRRDLEYVKRCGSGR